MTAHDSHPRNDLALAEAALFLAPQPLTRRGLAKILGGVAQAYVDQLLVDLKEQFEDPSRGIEVHIEDGRAQFRVKSAYVDEVSHLAPQHDIPRQELRTLAVIAYNHPMTQANLIKIRGNKGYKHVQALLERNLITSEPHSRTCLLHVTRDFLRHFGLSSVEEFRVRFPTAAEENAEELARGAQDDDDYADNDGEGDTGNATGIAAPSGENQREPDDEETLSYPSGEPISKQVGSEGSARSELLNTAASVDDPEPPEPDVDEEPTGEAAEDDSVDEQDTKPFEEVERE